MVKKGLKCPKEFKWKLTDKRGRKISCHRTKKQAQKAQSRSGRANRYVKKC